jgi:hypothetical protein
MDKDDEKFLKRRENFIKRLQTQINGFLSQYSIFGEKFVFKERHMRDFLQSEFDKCVEVAKLIDQVKQLESNELRALSSRIDHNSNKRDIITIPPPPPPPPRAPGLISPYLSKVSVPSDQGPQSSRKRSSNDPSIRKASVQGSIIEVKGSQVAKERYD